MSICISEIKAFFGIENVVVQLIYGFSITSNDHHKKLFTMALALRQSSLASFDLSTWHHIATDLMFLKRYDLLKVTVS
jgi:hypothetical protein